MDVWIPRADYEKLEQIVNSETDTPYRVMNFHNTKGFTLAYGKLVHTGTSLVEHVAGAVDTGLFVDIFPFDGLPEKDTPEYDRHWKKLLFLRCGVSLYQQPVLFSERSQTPPRPVRFL